MKNILSAILFQLNPVTLPISLLIFLGLRTAVGKEADPSYREPQPTDRTYITFIENYVRNGQPIEQAAKYRLYCKYLGVPVYSPFHSSHPLSKVTIL